MMRTAALLFASATAAVASAAVVLPGALPANWVAAPLVGEHAIVFSVALKEQNMNQLKQIALAVSDPTNADYGNHRSAAEIAALTAPAAADAAAVKAWLDGSACAVLESSTDRLIDVRCSAAAASTLLATSFRTLTNTATGQSVVKAAELTLPNEVDAAVAAFFGLHGLPLPPRRSNRAAEAAWNQPMVAEKAPMKPAANVTPAVIAEVYKVSGVTVDRTSKNKQAVAEFQGQTMNTTDLATYFKLYVPDAKPGDEVVHKFIGDPGAGGPQDEASLDIQFM